MDAQHCEYTKNYSIFYTGKFMLFELYLNKAIIYVYKTLKLGKFHTKFQIDFF